MSLVIPAADGACPKLGLSLPNGLVEGRPRISPAPEVTDWRRWEIPPFHSAAPRFGRNDRGRGCARGHDQPLVSCAILGRARICTPPVPRGTG